jgi:DNA repair protein RadC
MVMPLVLETRQFDPKIRIKSSRKVAELAYNFIGDQNQEFLLVLTLTSSGQPISLKVVHIGGINYSVVEPASVFRQAIIEGAASIILIHNHPSGDPKPSHEDFEITRKIKQAGDLIGIELIDHVIFGTRNGLTHRSIFESVRKGRV